VRLPHSNWYYENSYWGEHPMAANEFPTYLYITVTLKARW